MTVTKDWWRGSCLYEIYPRSFADSNDDGIGDLPGITSRLGYIKKLGVDAIWIAPFFTSPMADFGYDVADYRDVDPCYGTLQDFKRLLAEAHAQGLRVLIDLVMSHSSVEHDWFKRSRESHTNDKSDWYVWADGRDNAPPNNWVSVFGGPAWNWSEQRGQFYLHHFLKDQPQLNLYNPKVREALFDVARFWLDIGVDGFRLDAVDFYMHDASLTDNPPSPEPPVPGKDFSKQLHLHDMMLPQPTLDFISEFRQLLDQYDGERIAIGEVSSQPGAFGRIGLYTAPGRLHAAYSLKLAKEKITPQGLVAAYEEMIKASPEGCICWSFSNHDAPRVMSRHATGSAISDMQQARLFAMLRQWMPGIDCLYQGEELGLTDAVLTADERRDPVAANNRDGSRTPMPWRQATALGGFTGAQQSWLPLPREHLALAVDAQEKNPDSLLRYYRQALKFKRKHEILRQGKARFRRDGDRLTITRGEGGEEMSLALNFGAAPVLADGVALQPYGFRIARRLRSNLIRAYRKTRQFTLVPMLSLARGNPAAWLAAIRKLPVKPLTLS